MKLLMSQANFDRIAARLSPIERDRLAERVQLYPDGEQLELVADQQRIAARFGQLLDDQMRPLWPPRAVTASGPTVWEYDPDRTGDEPGVPLPAPWEQAAPGMWIAPGGTPPPWTMIAEMLEGQIAAQQRSRVISQLGVQQEPPAGRMLELTRDAMTALAPMRTRAQRLRAGEQAYAAIRELTAPQEQGWPEPGAAAALTGLPIDCDEDLDPRVWQLVDDAGEVILHGSIGPSLADYLAVFDQVVAELAEKAEIPRFLLD